MTEGHWFSARIRLVCLIKPVGGLSYMDSIYVFRSTDFDDAFTKALEIGRSQERNYLNDLNQQVVWKLKEIISLDLIRAESLDGAEVYSEHINFSPDESIPFDSEFNPEASLPTQTV